MFGISRQGRSIRGRAWVALRSRVLSHQPLCVLCAADGRTTAASEIDHIVPVFKGGTDDLANLQPLCAACHATKTNADLNRKPIGCDENGLPTDARHHWAGGRAPTRHRGGDLRKTGPETETALGETLTKSQASGVNRA